MIGRIIIDLVVDALLYPFRGNGKAPLPRRARHELGPGERLVSVTASAMHERAAAYRRWAEEHGLAPSRERGVDYHGEVRGRRVRFFTGLFDTPRPRAVWLSVGDARMVLGPFVETSELDAALEGALDSPGDRGYR